MNNYYDEKILQAVERGAKTFREIFAELNALTLDAVIVRTKVLERRGLLEFGPEGLVRLFRKKASSKVSGKVSEAARAWFEQRSWKKQNREGTGRA